MAVWGGVLGGSAKGIGDAKLDNAKIADLLSRLGGSAAIVDAYLGAVLGITGLVVAAYTVQATLRLRGEEAAGRLEPLLATRTRRVQWALSHLAFAVVGTALLLAVAGPPAGSRTGRRSATSAGRRGRCWAPRWSRRRRRGCWRASGRPCSAWRRASPGSPGRRWCCACWCSRSARSSA
ncbi:hypothetical protein ACFQX7_30410 [Luedemannella flava]